MSMGTDKGWFMARGAGGGAGGGAPGGGGRGQGGRGQGGGRKGGFARGPGGNCVCPSCGKTVSHEQGVPCFETRCPDCGALMTRQR